MLQSFDKLCFLSTFETSDRVLSHLVQFLFCLDLISRAAAIPLHCFPMKRAQLPDQTNKKTQIVSNFANPSIVLGTILLRQTELYFLFSPSVQFLFCSVLFGSNQAGKKQSLFNVCRWKEPNSQIKQTKTQIISNFANPYIVLGTLLCRQTESYFLLSPLVQFLFCSVQFCSDPIRRESGNPSSLFGKKNPDQTNNKFTNNV